MRTGIPHLSGAALLLAVLCLPISANAEFGIEASYHGQLGHETGTGMLEKWCALPNFSFDQQGGIDGWTQQSCNGCHVGAAWNPTKPWNDCSQCHSDGSSMAVNLDACLACHVKDTAKRGDAFTVEADVHIAAGMLCQDCHEMAEVTQLDHNFLKGTAIDTTEATMKGTLSCTSACHDTAPHSGSQDADRLNSHVEKVACETCHTGLRPAAALVARYWNRFDEEGTVVSVKHEANWLPEHKWYDQTGAGAAGNYLLPILGYTERRNDPGARIYPFNAVTVSWFVKTPESAYDDVIIVPDVKAADADRDGTVTVDEIRLSYPEATLLTEDMNFSISHSVTPKAQAFTCDDCHGPNGWVLNWTELGYDQDPGKHYRYRVRDPRGKGP